MGFSDHILLKTKIDIPYLKDYSPAPQTNFQEPIYKWVEGTCLQEYGAAATKWSTYTSQPEFLQGLQAVISNNTISNDARATEVEEFIL